MGTYLHFLTYWFLTIILLGGTILLSLFIYSLIDDFVEYIKSKIAKGGENDEQRNKKRNYL